MAYRDSSMLTLVDVAKRTMPGGSIQTEGLAELLEKETPVLLDMPMVQCNKQSAHQAGIRTGIPVPAWVKIGYGVRSQKSHIRMILFNTGMMKELSEIPADLIELGNNVASVRATEDIAFIESMAQEMSDTVFYGDEATEESSFTGLSHYFNDKSAQNGKQIVDAGGTGSALRSIWIICWHETTCHGIYPEGYGGGLQVEDMGKFWSQTAPVEGGGANDGRMQVYGMHYKWSMGLAMKDWRFICRIANIDKTEIVKDASSGPDLIDLLLQGLDRIRNMNRGPVTIYADRDIVSALNRQLPNKTRNSTLTMEEVYGKNIMSLTCRGVPIHYTDSLDMNETRVT